VAAVKVLVVNNLFPPHTMGGAERSVDVLVSGLIEHGIDVGVLTLRPPGASEGERRGTMTVTRAGLRNLYWPFDEVARPALSRLAWHAMDSYNPLMSSAVRAALLAESPDLVHTNNLAGFSVAAWRVARELGVPVLHTIRDYYLLCLRSTRQKNDRSCTRQCMDCVLASVPRRRAGRAVTSVIGNSRYVLDAHLDAGHFADAPYRDVIYNAYRPERAPQARAEKRPGGVLRIGYLGRLHPTKGIEVLIDAFTRVHAGAARLAIGGKGSAEYVAALKNRAQGAPIEFLGYVEAGQFLAQLDLLVVPSVWDEPLPRAVYEAFAHGVAVVASRRGGTPEIVDDGVNGLLFDPWVDRLAALLQRCIAEPELLRRLSEGARASASRFLPERTVERYVDAYRRTIEHGADARRGC
jgi:glycosyltransferase involved in cell wall biosynthesis